MATWNSVGFMMRAWLILGVTILVALAGWGISYNLLVKHEVKSTGLSCEDFTEKLIMEEKVAVVPGTAFGEQGVGHVRCCYATSMENIEKALVRIARFVEKQKAIRVS